VFDAAIVSTSAYISNVAEAFAMHETLSVEHSIINAVNHTLSAGATVDPQQLVPQQVGDPSSLATLTGITLLQQLTLLEPTAIADFVSGNPEAVQTLVDRPPAAREVQLWWQALGIEARATMITSAPQVIGNLDGVPFSLRDYANRWFLNTTLAELSTTIENASARSEALDSSTRLDMLGTVLETIAAPAGAAPRSLLSLDASGTGRAAVVIGDLATADYVSILVPGMFYTVDGQLLAWTLAAQGLYDEQVKWLTELGLPGTVAVVAWIGYETPSMVNFTALDLAYEGSAALAKTVTGLHTMRGDNQPYLALIAHSYGSTVSMMALTDYGIDADALAVFGSPGSAAQSASELGIPGDNVFVGEAEWDQIKDSAFFGSDPGSASFGAHRFRVLGGVDPITGEELTGSTGHDEYLMPGSESLRNLALVALGQGRLATSEGGSLPPKLASGYSQRPR
jgi:pimeloyl-ACP methyl ester carboxylesterase